MPATELAASGGIQVVDDFEPADSPVTPGIWRIEAFVEFDDAGDCKRLEVDDIAGPDGQAPSWGVFSHRLTRYDVGRIQQRLIAHARAAQERRRADQERSRANVPQ
jgi:hypothetical protein